MELFDLLQTVSAVTLLSLLTAALLLCKRTLRRFLQRGMPDV